MPDVFWLESEVPSLDTVDSEIRAGLPCERERIDAARTADDYYQGRNKAHLERRPDEDERDFEDRPKRFSRITRLAVRKLSDPMYSPGPSRTWEGSADLQSWLEQVYTSCHANARMQTADRGAMLSHVAALQWEATGNPNDPLRLWPWKAHEFAVFTVDGNPLRPWCVVTIEEVPAGQGKVRTRYRAWTAFERRTYLSEPWHLGTTAGGRRADTIVSEESGDSPYPGVLPFTFVRNEPPECRFWEGGIGGMLAETNAYIDRALCDLAEHISKFLSPLGYSRNVSSVSGGVAPVGGFFRLVADPSVRSGEMRGEPELAYLQAQLGVEAAWHDIETYANQALEEHEIPLTIIRADASTDLSGVAIVAKQMPLIERTRARQPMFSEFESDLAATALAVAGTWYGDAAKLAAASDPALIVVWPEPRIPLPSPERNEADAWELEQGLADPIEVLARRRGITLDQAEELAAGIAERRARWAALMGATINPDPASGDDPNGREQQPDPEADDDEPEPDPDEGEAEA